jgi:glycosyltransferase involved in cell wall biosynthesis
LPESVSFFISHDFPEGNAKNARIKAYAKGLMELGLDCKIWIGYSSKFNEDQVNTQHLGKWEGIPFEFLANTTTYKPNFAHRLKCWYKANINAIRKLRKTDTQEVSFFYMPTWFGLLPAFVFASLSNKRPIAMQTEQFSSGAVGLQKWFRYSEERALVRFASCVLTISSGLTAYFRSISSKDNVLEVTPVVVDHSRFEPNAAANHPTFRLGYVGSYNLKEGMQNMLKAWQIARKEVPQLTFVSMGKVTADMTLPEGLESTGFFRFDDLPTLLQKCDALIVNREDTAYSRLGFPIKLGEYLASVRTVFLCDFPEYRRYLDDDEVRYFKPNNADDLAEKLIEFYSNYSTQTARKGYQKSLEIFSKSVAAEELKSIFERLN